MKQKDTNIYFHSNVLFYLCLAISVLVLLLIKLNSELFSSFVPFLNAFLPTCFILNKLCVFGVYLANLSEFLFCDI